MLAGVATCPLFKFSGVVSLEGSAHDDSSYWFVGAELNKFVTDGVDRRVRHADGFCKSSLLIESEVGVPRKENGSQSNNGTTPSIRSSHLSRSQISGCPALVGINMVCSAH
jgi:hypothetical protein